MSHPQSSNMKEQLSILLKEKHTKSWLSLWAEAWGEKPWWLKAIFLGVISLGTIVPAVVFQMWPLLIATVFIALVYISMSLLLDNHHARECSRLEKTNQQAQCITDSFETLGDRLDVSATQLEQEVDAMQQHNEDLDDEISHLSDITEDLDRHSQHLSNTADQLGVVTQDLKKNNQTIQSTIEAHQHQAERETQIQDLNKKVQDEKNVVLQQQMAELQRSNILLQLKVEHFRIINRNLVINMGDLRKINQNQQEGKEKFQESMDKILQNTENLYINVKKNLENNCAKFEQEVKSLTDLNTQVAHMVNTQQKENVQVDLDRNRLYYHNCPEPMNRSPNKCSERIRRQPISVPVVPAPVMAC